MKGKYHLLTSIIFFIILWLSIPKIKITEILMPIILSLYPDIDLKFTKYLGHRSIWTHSIIIPFIIFLFNPSPITILFIVSVGLHLACDLRFTKQSGFYTIVILKVYLSNKVHFPRYRLNGRHSTTWLAGNFIISMVILITWCLI